MNAYDKKIMDAQDLCSWILKEVQESEAARKRKFFDENEFHLDGESSLLFHIKALNDKLQEL